MSSSELEDSGSNFFHSLAALGQAKLALKTISTTQRKVVTGSLVAKDKQGRTPLHLAAYYGHLKVLKVFLEAYPEAGDIRDGNGNSVRDALRRPEASVIGDPENQKCFQRLIKLDKVGFEHQDFGHGPSDVWDVSVSGNSMVAVIQPTWGQNQDKLLYSMMKGKLEQLDLGLENSPRYVATSNIHSLVLTADKCFVWGKNVNGVLGLDVDDKIVTTPTPLDFNFVEWSQKGKMNAFSALGGTGSSTMAIRNPLIGVDCCDFHSVCYSTTKIWAWGANRGQMSNKAPRNTIVETPILVYQTEARIRAVRCCDNAIVVLLSSGQVHLMHNDRIVTLQVGRNSHEVESIAARGDYIVVHTNTGKLSRCSLRNPLTGKEDFSSIWTPRRKKDEVVAFDVGDNGGVVVATKSSVFKVEEGRDIVEFKMLKGMPLTTIKTDPQFRNFVAVNNILAGFEYNSRQTAVKMQHGRYGEVQRYVKWEGEDSCKGDMTLAVGKECVPVHSSVLFARCPTLRPLIVECIAEASAKSEKMVSAPGGSAVFRVCAEASRELTVDDVPLESVAAFVRSLYHSRDAPKPEFNLGSGSGITVHEFHALERLITRDLGPGLWEANIANIGCDVKVNKTHQAHSAILASASPVLAAQLSRWSGTELDDPALSETTIDDVLQYAYTMDLQVSCGCDSERAERLFEIWQVADELLMASLSEECEQMLFKMMSFDLVIPFIEMISRSQGTTSSRLFHSLLDVIVRYLSFFMPVINVLDAETLDAIERLYKQTPGTEPVNKELADAFDKLKTQANISLATPKSGKKKKNSTPPSSNPPAGAAVPSQTNFVPSSALPQSPLSHVSTASTGKPTLNASELPSVSFASASKPVKSKPQHESQGSQSTNDISNGWIQARRKPRTSSQNTRDKMEEKLGSATPTLKSLSSSSSRSSVSPVPGGSSTLLNSPTLKPVLKHEPATAATAVSNSSSSASPSSSSQLASLSSLPKLGEGLPTLGSKPRASSSSKGPRPKFNRMNKKNAQQFDNPMLFAETFGGKSASSPPGGTPWRQIPKAVQTSQSVLQRLEQVQQTSSRNFNGGSVWGV